MNFYLYKANIVRVIDGDTIVCDIDLGFDLWMKDEHVRLLGLDAPESRTKDLVEKAKGIESTEWLTQLLEDHGNVITLETTYNKGGKYGRTLGNIYVDGEDGLININEKMIEEGYAVVY